LIENLAPTMTKLEMFEEALQVLGDASAETLAAFIQKKHSETIDPRFIPLFVASIRDRNRLEALRRERAVSRPSQTRASPVRSVVPESQRAKDAEALAQQLIAQHGLWNWEFAFNRRKQSMGLCVHSRKTIELSIHFVDRDNPWEEVRDTILHEIAHALVGPKHGHDRVWKRKCLQIGAKPRACGDADMPEGKWKAECQCCGKQFDRHRKPKRAWFCQACGPEKGRLVWKEAA
jgi:predicted SprT family Zn-dependent metalloprotease